MCYVYVFYFAHELYYELVNNMDIWHSYVKYYFKKGLTQVYIFLSSNYG